jgi:RNA polymerase sigma factor (sigma-70 family)
LSHVLPAQRTLSSGGRTAGELVRAAANGDQGAWNDLVDRFSGLVWGVARKHRLNDSDAADVCQATWLRLVEHLGNLREPEAVAGWLVTTARRECLRVLRESDRQIPVDVATEIDLRADDTLPDADAALLELERAEALRRAFAGLPASCRALLAMLLADPPHSYVEISERLGMPIGSIGPTRARALDRLRRSPELTSLFAAAAGAHR